MGITSDEYISEVQSLLSCPFKIAFARSIQGNKAQTFVDSLDQVGRFLCALRLLNSWPRIQVLARSCLDDKLQQRGLRLLSKICKTHRIIPSSYILRWELVRVGWVYHESGFAVVSNGEYSGCPVAIKHLKMDKADADATLKVPSIILARYRYSASNQRLCREIIIWKHLSHVNIMPLLGVLASGDPRCLCILTEWMPNGNVIQFTRSNPNENRLRLVSSLAVSP